MTTGTAIAEMTLRVLGRHTREKPANEEDMEVAKYWLQEMMEKWSSMGIDIDVRAINASNDALSEVSGSTVAVVSNLSFLLLLYLNINVPPGKSAVLESVAEKDLKYVKIAFPKAIEILDA